MIAETVDPNSSPGGIVVRVYDLAEELLHEAIVPPSVGKAAALAMEAAMTARGERPGEKVILAVYDGTHGRRTSTLLMAPDEQL